MTFRSGPLFGRVLVLGAKFLSKTGNSGFGIIVSCLGIHKTKTLSKIRIPGIQGFVLFPTNFSKEVISTAIQWIFGSLRIRDCSLLRPEFVRKNFIDFLRECADTHISAHLSIRSHDHLRFSPHLQRRKAYFQKKVPVSDARTSKCRNQPQPSNTESEKASKKLLLTECSAPVNRNHTNADLGV